MKKKSSKAIMRVYTGDKNISRAAMQRLFLKQLDNIYCIKKHLIKILPPLAEQASFSDLKAAVIESADQIKVQLLRMDIIFKMFDTEYKDHDCPGVKTLSLEAYMDVRVEGQELVERDLNLLIHLQIIESVETAYFGVLKNIADNLNNDEITLMLNQNFEIATNAKTLYDLIAREYIL